MRLALSTLALLLWAPLVQAQVLAQPPAPSQNLVQNSGFENEAEAWAIPAGFGNLDAAQKHGDASSLRLSSSDAASYQLVTQRVPCTPGGRFEVSAWIKGQDLVSLPNAEANRGASVFLEFYDQKGQWLGGAYPEGKLGTFDWAQVSAPARVPTAARSMAVGLYFRRGTTGTAWFDDIQVRSFAQPLQVFLKAPGYRGLLLASDRQAWQADLVVERAASEQLRIRSQVLIGERVVASRIVAVPVRQKEDLTSVVVPITQLAGDIAQRSKAPRWRLQVLRGEEVLATQQRQFQVVQAMPRVHIARGGSWMVEGKPFFPLGIYLGPTSDTSDENLQRIAGAGFNTVLCYAYGAGEDARGFLERAQKHKLRVIFSLKDFFSDLWDFPRQLNLSADELTRRYVTQLRDHPALLAWYLNDEAGLEKEPELRARYDLVQSLDSQHPSVHVLYQWGLLDGYYDLADVLGVDPYPDPESSYSNVSQWLDATRVASRGAKSPLAVTKAFSGAVYPPTPEGSRPPSTSEMRCMNLLALCSGARGVLLYAYMDLWMKDSARKERDEAKFVREWASVSAVSRELQTLLPILRDGQDRAMNISASDNADVRYRVIRHGGKTYLLAANSGLQAQSFRWVGKEKLTPLLGDLTSTTNRDETVVQLGPHGSGVFLLQ